MLSLLVAALIVQAPPPRPPAATPKPSASWQARAGEHAEIRIDGVMACEYEADFDDLNRFVAARDLVGIRKLLAEGDAVPLLKGTAVLVISAEDKDQPGSPIEVRVQSGRYSGRKLYVAEPNLGRVQLLPPKASAPLGPHVRRRLEKRRRASAAIDALSRPAATAPADPFD